jgi:hypothetical protein
VIPLRPMNRSHMAAAFAALLTPENDPASPPIEHGSGPSFLCLCFTDMKQSYQRSPSRGQSPIDIRLQAARRHEQIPYY